jgi:hypothetical protein
MVIRIHTIHASFFSTKTAQFDRNIVFRRNCRFAVVLIDYVEGKGYSIHVTENSVILKTKQLKEHSYKIIDDQGNEYFVSCGVLNRINE